MKTPISSDESPRFNGSRRHYHHSASQPLKSWDEWVEGKIPGASRSKFVFKIIIGIVALLALAGIVIGLVIELS